MEDLESMIKQLAGDALVASRALGVTPTEQKNTVLETLANLIESEAEALRVENAKDLEAGRANGLRSSLLDRLELTPARIASMAEGVRQVAALPDPVGAFLDAYDHPKGFVIRKKRVPIGVIGIIYESRPNVTVDCAALCLKSGNACVLRGGKEAIHSNRALADLIARALRENGVTENAVRLIPTTDRAALNILLKLDDCIHCLIPRGGEGLIRFVAEHARMPVLKHYDGICHVYVHPSADPEMAAKIVVNAKAQRPSVCNAAENFLIDRALLDSTFPAVAKALFEAGVTLRADTEALAALDRAGIAGELATEADFRTEYLDYILAIKTVEGVDEAIEFVNTHSSSHSDAIVAEDGMAAQRFLDGVDSATVYWNVSTRFTDGFEFGKGAEIGISTDRLHARGPVGLEELTSYKYVITGHGEIK